MWANNDIDGYAQRFGNIKLPDKTDRKKEETKREKKNRQNPYRGKGCGGRMLLGDATNAGYDVGRPGCTEEGVRISSRSRGLGGGGDRGAGGAGRGGAYACTWNVVSEENVRAVLGVGGVSMDLGVSYVGSSSKWVYSECASSW